MFCMNDSSNTIDLSKWISIIIQIVPYLIKVYQKIINRVKWRSVSKEARDIASAIHSYSWTNLQQTAPIIKYVGLINRPEIKLIKEHWQSSDTPILLFGGAGTGKSGIALRLGQILSKDGMPVLFLRATEFPNEQDPVVFIQNRMAIHIPLIDAIAQLSKERPCSIIVDQLDSVAGTDLGKSLIGFLKSLAGLQNVKVMAVSRLYETTKDPDVNNLGFQKIESGLLSTENAINYLSLIGLSTPSQTIIDLATNLLNLSLISDVISYSQDNQKAILSEVELWKQFFSTIQQREGDEVAEFVIKLAREKAAIGERTFVVQFPSKEIRRKLLSRGILIDALGRRFTFRHEQLQDFLCAYSLLPEQPTLDKLLNEFGNNIPKNIIHWLHLLYHNEYPDAEAGYINNILGAKGKIPFYTRTIILDDLKNYIEPTEIISSVLFKQFENQEYQKYFFDDLENHFWIIPLHKTGFFYNPPQPVEVQPGYYQIPVWFAGKYLVMFAEIHEDMIIDIVRNIQTENWRAQENLIDAILKISPQAIEDLIPEIDTWADGRFSDMLPVKLNSLTNHLVNNGLIDVSILIFEIVIKPIYTRTTRKISKFQSNITFRADHYWVNEYCNEQLSKLLTKNPIGVIKIFERQLIRAIELVKNDNPENAEINVGYHWRLDIPNRLSDRSDGETLDILIDGFRDSLMTVCEQSVDNGQKFLSEYLTSEHLIIRRIALYALRKFGKNYPDLLNQSLDQCDYLEKSEYYGEYLGLMRDQFEYASDEIREKVIDWIIDGPRDIELKASLRAKWENRDITNDDLREIKEQWILFHLEIIRDFLSGETITLLGNLSKQYGKPNVEERPHVIVTTWGGARSPISAEELAKKSFEEIKELFLSFVQEESFHNPRESLALTFQEVVRGNPDSFIDFADLLIDPEIRFVYIFNYLSGFRESLKRKLSKLNDGIIRLCEYVVDQKNDKFYDSSGDHEPGLIEAQLEVARMLEEALRSDDPYLNRDQLNRIRSLLIILSHHSDPKKDEDIGTSFDPFTQSLNCVRGEAMHGIIHYSLYLVRQQGKINNEKLKRGFLEKEIQDLLDEKLDISTDPSLAVHSIFGAYFPQLQYLAREWVEENSPKIFPDEIEKASYWKAAWNAYLFTSNVYKDVFPLLVTHYQRGLKILSNPEVEHKYLGGSPNEKLAQHIMFLYIEGYTDFGHENQLLDLFFSNAPDSIRASGIFWLSKVLESQHLSIENYIWNRCWTLWQNRIETAETEDVSQNTQEISDYMRWLKICPLGVDVLYPVLYKSIKYFNIGYHVKILNKYIANYCDQFPLEAVILLKKSIIDIKESWWKPEDKDEEKILNAAMASGNEEARSIALEIINYRGEQGDYRWKKFIYPNETGGN
jgi:hypothetical protein